MAHFIEFQIGGWRVGQVGSASGVFAGNNLQYGWRNSGKTNMASPRITGDGNIVREQTSSVVDPDLLDTYVRKPRPFENMPAPSPALARLWAQRAHSYQRAGRHKSD